VEVETADAHFYAISIVERDGTELLSPPWKGYYTSLGLGASALSRTSPPA
jgi:hypothetical protein